MYGDLTEELNAQFKTFHDISMFPPFLVLVMHSEKLRYGLDPDAVEDV